MRTRWKKVYGEDGAAGRLLVRARRMLTRSNVTGAALVLCAVLPLLVMLHAWANSGVVYGGVRIGEVSLGGMTREEAEAALREQAEEVRREIRLEVPGGEPRTIPAERIGVSLDPAAAAERAYLVGREGGLLERMGERAGALFGGIEVPSGASLDRAALREEVVVLARELEQPPQEASVIVQGAKVSVTEARSGYTVDIPGTRRSVEEAVESLSGSAELVGRRTGNEISTEEAERVAGQVRQAVSGPVTFTGGGRTWRLSAAEVGQLLRISGEGGELRAGIEVESLREVLGKAYSELEVEPVEAGYAFEGDRIVVTGSSPGRKIEEERLVAELQEGLFSGVREYEIPLAGARPELTTAEAERLRPTTLLGEFATDYTWDTDPGRRANMSLASEAINGATVAPGEVFSYNSYAEPLEYEEAKVIVEGAAEYAEGGGLSQVSTTLYMAANLAGLEIVEATPHMAELPYIRPGLDTTVWFGAIDLRFRNNTGGYIMIQTWMGEDGYHHARIYGPETGKRVTISSELVNEREDRQGRRVTTWVAYKTITRGEEVLFDGEFRRVTYRELEPSED
jgi:vancomycin resistance protein YoaR